MEINLSELLGLVALSLGMLLIVKVAFQPADDRVAKWLLLGLIAGFGAIVAAQLYLELALHETIPQLAGSLWPLRFSIAPLLYFYVRRLTGGHSPTSARFWLVHWLLPVGVLLILVPFFALGTDAKLALIRSGNTQAARGLLYLVNYLQILAYVYICHKHLSAYGAEIKQHFSNLVRINLGWLEKIIYGLVLLPLVDIVLPMFGVVSTDLYYVLLTLNALFLILLTYSAFGHSQLQFPLFAADTPSHESAASDTARYVRSGLRGDTARHYLQKLERLAADEQCFLDESLSLSSMAAQLGLSPHHLSQLLNEHLGTNFFDYVNNLRIAHAKTLLLRHLERPIIEIALESGYGSKSTFYTAFKMRSGMTPAQYRRLGRTGATLTAKIPDS